MKKKIMLLGTGSSVGKSILTTALCRIFYQKGYKVAPFKAQNMSRNSYVTKDGGEMGRAQVIQAEACGLEPSVEMNPILLKPTTDVGSQVILKGKLYKHLRAKDYYLEKNYLEQEVEKVYHSLEEKHDLIVIEGAGGCAEINLRDKDIVNMGLAELIDADAILIGDIERGGVFASIYGSIMLMSPQDRKRVKGFIINKFRGDIEILQPGITMLEEKIGIPCLGVIPYLDFQIDDEDSVSERFQGKRGKGINVGILKLPHLSNFTDFTPLEAEEDIGIRYITGRGQMEDMDFLILPASENPLADREFLVDQEVDQDIYKKHKAGIPIMGIGGGYQILGKEIIDPYAIESSIQRVHGLGLLNIRTTLGKDKARGQVEGKILPSFKPLDSPGAIPIKGYEIHTGETEILGQEKPAIELENGKPYGSISPCGKVFGTYMHGILENDEFRKRLLNGLREKKGLEGQGETIDYQAFKVQEYDKLAQGVLQHLDLPRLKEIMGL